MPQFEVFRRRAMPLVKQPYVTVQKSGTMSLNKAAHAALGAPDAVELLYDPKERIIGIRAVDASESHAYPLRAANNGSSYVLSITAFTHYYEIPVLVSTRRLAQMDNDILCVDLKDAGTEVTSNRNGHKKAAEAVPVPEPS